MRADGSRSGAGTVGKILLEELLPLLSRPGKMKVLINK